MEILRKRVFHPFLFAIYPVLFYYSINMRETVAPVREVLLPLITTIAAAVVLLLILTPLVKDVEKRGLIVSLLFLTFFSYGQFLTLFEVMGWTADKNHAPHLYSLFLFLIALIVPGWLILRKIVNSSGFTKAANVMGSILLVFCLIQIGITKHKMHWPANSNDKKTAKAAVASDPSIYYIILDTYTNEEILNKYYHYDNSKFIGFLKNKGFQVVDSAKSNYCTTVTSLASSLNMKYLNLESPDEEGDEHDIYSIGDSDVVSMLEHNEVVNYLKSRGYLIETFSSGSAMVNLSGSDVENPYNWTELTEFQWLLVNMTPVNLLLNRKERIYTPQDVYHRRISRVFDYIEDTAKIEKPAFVFAHILAPHSPLVYVKGNGKEGRFEFSRDYYVSQVEFVNAKVEHMVDYLQKNLKHPAIIIIQGDHGPSSVNLDNPNFDERFSILNAVYLPDQDKSLFDKSVTPVNTFKLIFSKYFGTKIPLSGNHQWFSTTKEPAKFINVDDKVMNH